MGAGGIWAERSSRSGCWDSWRLRCRKRGGVPLAEKAEREHGEAQAGRLLRAGLPVVGREESQLSGLAKGAPEKQVLAWWLSQHTTVRRRWVSERLGMGDESRVAQAIGQVTKGVEPGLEGLKAELERIHERNALAEV